MKRKFFNCCILFFCIIFVSCSSRENFTTAELSEFSDLAEKLEQKDFTFGKKMEDSKTLKLYKVRENFSREEDFFSLEEFSLIENKIKFVQKEKKGSVFLEFAAAPSGWGRGIIYLKNQNDIQNRAEVFIHLKDELYYFEGKF